MHGNQVGYKRQHKPPHANSFALGMDFFKINVPDVVYDQSVIKNKDLTKKGPYLINIKVYFI